MSQNTFAEETVDKDVLLRDIKKEPSSWQKVQLYQVNVQISLCKTNSVQSTQKHKNRANDTCVQA